MAPIQSDLIEAIREKTCVLYAGAGFSLEATLPDGRRLPTGAGLGHRLALDLHRDGILADEPKPDETFDFAELADDYETRFGRHRLVELLTEIFGADGLKPGEAHRLAVRFFPVIITTNYDALFEDAVREQSRRPVVIRRDAQLSLSGASGRTTVVKLHGDLEAPERIVISKTDYNSKPISEGLRAWLTTTLTQKTVLFVGSGLADPDLQEVYFEVLERLGRLKPRAFLVTPFPAADSRERPRWELHRKRWEGRSVSLVDGWAGDFLRAVSEQLAGADGATGAAPTAVAAPRRSAGELFEAYRARLAERVGKVYIVGEAEARALDKLFVELNIVEDYQRPSFHAEYLGLLDADMRLRRNPFAAEQAGALSPPGGPAEQAKRTLKPDEFLRGRAQAVITGAPGGGKTTLLKYLALRTLEAGERLPVFLELKSVSAEDFREAKGNLAELLAAKAADSLPALQPAERESFRAHFLEQLAAGRASLFLDGLDEVSGTDFFARLCSSFGGFARSSYGGNTVLISTRPYALKARFEGLKEMEIAPMSPRQVEEFLRHYYGDGPQTRQLLQAIRQRRQLRELTRVPFLLALVVRLHRTHHEIAADRLELYRQIVLQLAVQLDKEKALDRADFHIPDPSGTLKLDFLRQLACDRLLVDDPGSQGDAARLVFTGDVLSEKARQFLERVGRPDVNAYLLADDVKATPLLREVGADVYAFSHLTIQEYLAASALARRPDYEQIFCRAYFNSTLVEMETLPMALGLVNNPGHLYTTLEQLPDSLSACNYRLRLRGLAYTRKLPQAHLTKLTDPLVEHITSGGVKNIYAPAALREFSAASGETLSFILDRLLPVLQTASGGSRAIGIECVAHLGGERVLDTLLRESKHEEGTVREAAVRVLGRIGSARATEALIGALADESAEVRRAAASLLGNLNDARAVE